MDIRKARKIIKKYDNKSTSWMSAAFTVVIAMFTYWMFTWDLKGIWIMSPLLFATAWISRAYGRIAKDIMLDHGLTRDDVWK